MDIEIFGVYYAITIWCDGEFHVAPFFYHLFHRFLEVEFFGCSIALTNLLCFEGKNMYILQIRLAQLNTFATFQTTLSFQI